MSDSEEVFDDVIDEFRDLDLILKHFEEWKRFDLDSYKEAYVNLSLPKIVSPLVRLSIITWNPFEVNIFNDFDEYSLLIVSHFRILT